MNDVRSLVIKVGSSLLTPKQGEFDRSAAETVVDAVADVLKRGVEVTLVSSGAIGVGMSVLGMATRPASLPDKQAVAAIGQIPLMRLYRELFEARGLRVAQVLVTREGLDNRVRYLNLRNTLHALHALENVVPIVNENDTVAVEEIQFGDNDTLAARIAAKLDADLLVILTNIEGLYDRRPMADGEPARLIDVVDKISPEIEELAGSTDTQGSVGGMLTKIDAARIATLAGVATVIADGRERSAVEAALRGERVGTYFVPASQPMTTRKRWIAFGASRRGGLVIDTGACDAILSHGKSLLPSGIVGVQGDFTVGAAVQVLRTDGTEIACGLVNYSSDEIERLRGHHTSEIDMILGRKDYDEIIHRDNLVVLAGPEQ